MRVLLLGGSGMLAADLIATAPHESEIVAVSRAQCDVTDADALRRTFRRVKPDLVVNASAYTAVDRAESERDTAFAVNGAAVGHIGALAAGEKVPVVHFSTDYVFPGTTRALYLEDDETRPINAYGASKLAGERALIESGARALIIRTQWLFGMRGRSFPRTMWERAQRRLPTRVVDDQWGRPTGTADLATVVWTLVRIGAAGIVHATNAGTPVTWFEFAKRVFDAVGAHDLLTPCTSADYPTAASRPAFSALGTARLEQWLGGPMPHWTDASDRFLMRLGETTARDP